jgi:pimeloyl-ACP methyl ester carboxylesterase
MLDARGSGRSEPSLACPEVEALAHPPVSEPLDSDRIRTEFVDAIAACRERLVSGGVDLTAFDLREMAADAEDLRVALDIQEWNIMATGTTSRIALEYLRRYPGNVRAAVLDSPEWPSIDPFVESIEATRHAISELVAACADDPVCRRVAPDLEADIEALAVRLDSNPNEEDVESGHVSFDDGWFRVWLRARLSFFRPPDTFVPVVVSALADAHVGAENLEADRITRRQLCQGFIPNCWTHLVQSFGMYQSVMCRDVLPFTDHGDLEALAGDQPGFDDAFVRSPFLESCAAWDAGRGDGVVATPVRTDVPTLVIVGLFDPFGMPPYAEEALTNFANGTLLVSPENGHQVTGTDTDPDTCIVGIRNAWVEDPTALPDTSCVEGLGLGFEDDLKNVIREGIG